MNFTLLTFLYILSPWKIYSSNVSFMICCHLLLLLFILLIFNSITFVYFHSKFRLKFIPPIVLLFITYYFSTIQQAVDVINVYLDIMEIHLWVANLANVVHVLVQLSRIVILRNVVWRSLLLEVSQLTVKTRTFARLVSTVTMAINAKCKFLVFSI